MKIKIMASALPHLTRPPFVVEAKTTMAALRQVLDMPDLFAGVPLQAGTMILLSAQPAEETATTLAEMEARERRHQVMHGTGPRTRPRVAAAAAAAPVAASVPAVEVIQGGLPL